MMGLIICRDIQRRNLHQCRKTEADTDYRTGSRKLKKLIRASYFAAFRQMNAMRFSVNQRPRKISRNSTLQFRLVNTLESEHH